jgi:hypothetical protein
MGKMGNGGLQKIAGKRFFSISSYSLHPIVRISQSEENKGK